MIKTYKSGRIRLKGADLLLLRDACWKRDEGRCQECGERVYWNAPPEHPLKFDMAHVKSRGSGGSDTLENVQTLCHQCHMKEHSGLRSSLKGESTAE